MSKITLDCLKSVDSLWVASAGTLKSSSEGVVCWSGFLRPTQMRILCINEQESPKHVFDLYSYIKINLTGLTEQLEYRVNTYGHVEEKYDHLIGFEEVDIVGVWLDQLRLLLKDTWSSINNNNLNGVLKKYLLDNEYEYFAGRYPEMLV
jgi:hypothetical protein